MDNAPFHKRQDTLDALQAEGHTVLWLSPYSLDFNPIEKTLAWIKRLKTLLNRYIHKKHQKNAK